MNELNELMENEYTAMSCMDTPMSDLVSKALEIVRKKITDKEYLEIESNMIGSYNHAEKFGFEQGFMRGIAVEKGVGTMSKELILDASNTTTNILFDLAAEINGIAQMIVGLYNNIDNDGVDCLSSRVMLEALFGVSRHLERISCDLEDIKIINGGERKA